MSTPNMPGILDLAPYPHLAALFATQVQLTPRHQPSLTKRLASATPEHLAMANRTAGWVTLLAGDALPRCAQDYDWICNLVLNEEFHFRRNNSYRLKTFADVNAEVYSNSELMSHYMNGLLMTQVWWPNHTESIRFFLSDFLAGFAKPFRHLEIGPGHGLLLYLAGCERLAQSLEAWDVSPESVAKTREAIRLLGGREDTKLIVQDLYAPGNNDARFDSIVLSEVLEHLEQPREALEKIRELMAPGARLFINMPINSPAPDHLFLLQSPEEVVVFVEQAGYTIEKSAFFPQINMTLDKARRTQSTINVALIATAKASY